MGQVPHLTRSLNQVAFVSHQQSQTGTLKAHAPSPLIQLSAQDRTGYTVVCNLTATKHVTGIRTSQWSIESSLCPQQQRITPRVSSLPHITPRLQEAEPHSRRRFPSALSVDHAQAHHQVETVSARQLRSSSLPAAASLTVACPHPETSAPPLVCLDLSATTLTGRMTARPVLTTTQ